MSEMTPVDEAAVDMLGWLEDQQHVGNLSLSTVARLVTLLVGETIEYRQSNLAASSMSVSGDITVLTQQHLFIATLHQPQDSQFGSVTVDVLPRSALRSLRVEGPESMSDVGWSNQSKDSVPRLMPLHLTYDDGSGSRREVVLDVGDRGRFPRLEAQVKQQQLIAKLLQDLTS